MKKNDSSDDQIFANILKALNAPPQIDPQAFRRRRLGAASLLRQFRRRLQEQAQDRRVRNVTLQAAIRRQIKSRNPGIKQTTLWQPLYTLLPFITKFDWRDFDIVPDVRDQGECGSCWAYVATEAFESSAMMQRANFNIPVNVASSLEPIRINVGYTLNCVRGENSQGCDGGRHEIAFTHYVDTGIPWDNVVISFDKKRFPKDSNLQPGDCAQTQRDRVQAVGWDYVHLPPHEVPPPRELKMALLEHGPLVVMLALGEEDQTFFDYGRKDTPGETVAPVFKSKTKGLGNHFVLLIGWDNEKRAWIIQNSFGPQWGYGCREGVSEAVNNVRSKDRGYMYIRWGSNDIGQYAAWVQAPIIGARGLFRGMQDQIALFKQAAPPA